MEFPKALTIKLQNNHGKKSQNRNSKEISKYLPKKWLPKKNQMQKDRVDEKIKE